MTLNVMPSIVESEGAEFTAPSLSNSIWHLPFSGISLCFSLPLFVDNHILSASGCGYSISVSCSSSSNIFLWRFFMSCVYHRSTSIAASIISRWSMQQLRSSRFLASGVCPSPMVVTLYPSVTTRPGLPFHPLLSSAAFAITCDLSRTSSSPNTLVMT